ncbi:MAG: hypothetical protein NC489_08360 [Ruminococcus flavefaciens]|nr:hypothetical protein [Ruminococcus flavefaciens]
MVCYYCKKYFSTKPDAMKHLDKVHAERLGADGLDSAQACYLTTHTSLYGVCQCSPECKEKTLWNYRSGKPYRISPKPECRARNTARARERLMNARGIDQHTLMSDMEHQRDMRKQKHTSGTYQFKTDNGKVDYESQLDKSFLIFCDRVMNLPSYAVLESPESFPYMDTKENVERWYTPDYYLPDYNLLVEIKEGGDHPNTNPAYLKETRYKVALKDEAMKKQTKYNFIRISGKNYGPFVEMLYNITHQQFDDEKPKKALVVITETASVDTDENFTADVDQEVVNPDNIRLIVGYLYGEVIPQFVGITDSINLYTWYLSNYMDNSIGETTSQNPIFSECAKYRLYKYIGPAEAICAVFPLIGSYAWGYETHQMYDILEILDSYNIFFDDGGSVNNNPQRRSDFIMIEEGVNHVSGV